MILIFSLNILSIFAKKGNDGNSTLSENGNFYEIPDKTEQVNSYGQPRFNTDCDIESLEAANECEARVLIFLWLTNMLYKDFNIIKFFIQKLLFSNPYSKKDLQMIFLECSENCEDQPCVAKCQRDFYINIDCKLAFYLLS